MKKTGAWIHFKSDWPINPSRRKAEIIVYCDSPVGAHLTELAVIILAERLPVDFPVHAACLAEIAGTKNYKRGKKKHLTCQHNVGIMSLDDAG